MDQRIDGCRRRPSFRKFAVRAYQDCRAAKRWSRRSANHSRSQDLRFRPHRNRPQPSREGEVARRKNVNGAGDSVAAVVAWSLAAQKPDPDLESARRKKESKPWKV